MTLETPVFLAVDWWAMGAVIALSVGILLLLLLEFLPTGPASSRSAIVSLLVLGVAAYAVLRVRDAKRALFGGMLVHDGFTVFFTLLFLGISALAVLLKMGTYGFVRFAMPLFPIASMELTPWIVGLAIVGI